MAILPRRHLVYTALLAIVLRSPRGSTIFRLESAMNAMEAPRDRRQSRRTPLELRINAVVSVRMPLRIRLSIITKICLAIYITEL